MKPIQDAKVVTLISPVADYSNGSARSNTINMQDYGICTALLCRGDAGATGTSTITANSSSTSAGTSLTAIPFKVKKATTGTQDAYDDEINVAATGYTTVANADNQVDIIEVDASDLDGDDKYLTIIATEVVNSPVLAGMVGVLSSPSRQQGNAKRTVRA